MTAEARRVASDRAAWHRLSGWAVAVVTVTWSIRFIRDNLYLFAGLGAGAVFLEGIGIRQVAAAGVAALTVLGILALAYFRRFIFRLDDDAIRLRRGLLERREVRVPFSRVLNVALSQPFYLRPLDLVVFSVDTAGQRKREVELPGVSRRLAEGMRVRILAGASASPPGPPGAAADPVPTPAPRPRDLPAEEASRATNGPEQVVHAASRLDLLLHGMMSNQLWLVAGGIAYLLSMLQERGVDLLRRLVAGGLHVAPPGPTWLSLVVLFACILLLLIALGGAGALIRYHGFELTRGAGRFRTRQGLFDRREQALAPHKLHALDIIRPAAGMLLGRGYLAGRHAGMTNRPAEAVRQRFLVPGLRWRTAWRLARTLDPGSRPPRGLEPIHGAYRTVVAFRFLVFAGAAILLTLILLPIPARVPLIALLVLPAIAWGMAHLRWRRWAVDENRGRLCVRSGFLGDRWTLFPMDRVQHVAVVQTILQRRRGVATLVLTLPDGAVRVPYLPFARATALANETLFRVETATVHRI